jgi:hypothetical protein
MKIKFLIILVTSCSFINAQLKISSKEDFVAFIRSHGAAKATDYFMDFRKSDSEPGDFQKAFQRVYYTVTNQSFISFYIMPDN